MQLSTDTHLIPTTTTLDNHGGVCNPTHPTTTTTTHPLEHDHPTRAPLLCRFAAARASVVARAAVRPTAARPVVARFMSAEELSPQDFDAKW
jgi:hypothetical protein